MRRSFWKLSAISGLLLAAMSSNVYAGDVKEPVTGKTFTDTIEVWGKSWVAIGTGLRLKDITIKKVQVYAIALYVEKEGAAVALAGWKGTATATAQADAKLFKSIIDCDCARGVELTYLRDIDGAKAKDAFIESTGIELKNLYGHGTDDASVKDDIVKLSDFLNYNIKTGNKQKFFVSKKGSISAVGPGGSLTIKNPKIGKALLSSWLGTSSRFTDDATLVTLKKGLVSNLSILY